MENKENIRSDISCKASGGKNANSSSLSSNSSKKEKRSFKCERLSNIFSRDVNSSVSANISTSGKEKIVESSSRRINSAPVYRKHSSGRYTTPDSSDEPSSNDLTMFPFDREAIDYERIQRECFEVEEEYGDANEDLQTPRNFSYQYANYADAEDSPLDQKIDIFQQYAIISRRECERQSKKKKKRGPQSPANRKFTETSALVHEKPATGSNLTSPIPDLKIDFFAESSSPMASSTYSRSSENENALDECQQQNSKTSSFGCKNNTNATSSSGAVASSNISNLNGSINLTSNPMSSVCTPRATIVVQQVRINRIFFSNFLACL